MKNYFVSGCFNYGLDTKPGGEFLLKIFLCIEGTFYGEATLAKNMGVYHGSTNILMP